MGAGKWRHKSPWKKKGLMDEVDAYFCYYSINVFVAETFKS